MFPRLAVRMCFDADVGLWRRVVVGEGEREREEGSSTITRERSSISDGADGRLLFRLDESLKTSEGSARGDVKFCRCFGGSGGTGGVKASMRGVDGYDATDVVDGDDVIVRYGTSVSGRCMATEPLTERSRVLDCPSILPRNADVFCRTEDFAF